MPSPAVHDKKTFDSFWPFKRPFVITNNDHQCVLASVFKQYLSTDCLKNFPLHVRLQIYLFLNTFKNVHR